MGKITLSIDDDLEATVRTLTRKKGDLSKLFEQAMRIFLKERGVEIKKAEI